MDFEVGLQEPWQGCCGHSFQILVGVGREDHHPVPNGGLTLHLALGILDWAAAQFQRQMIQVQSRALAGTSRCDQNLVIRRR